MVQLLNEETARKVGEKLNRITGDYKEQAGGIGGRFLIFRQALGKTKGQLAEESGFPVEYISGVELGEYIPMVFFFEYFYRIYGLDLTWVVTGQGKMFYPRYRGDYNDKTAFTGKTK